jgi:hypothetical protein
MGNLANALRRQGDYAGARDLDEQVLEARTRVLGPEHPDTLGAMSDLAGALSGQGDLAGARDLYEQVLEVRTRARGPEHPRTLGTMGDLSRVLSSQGDLAGARDLQERVLEAQTRVLGPEHPDTLGTMSGLARILGDQGDLAGARDLFEKVLESCTRVLGPDHPHTLDVMSDLAVTLSRQGDEAGARVLEEQVHEARTRVLGPEHPDTLRATGALAAMEGAAPQDAVLRRSPPRRLGRASTPGNMNGGPGSMRRFLSRRSDPERRFVELIKRANATTDSSLDHADANEQVSMWVQFLQMPVWWLVSDRGLVSVLDIGGIPTGMAAFDEQVLLDWAADRDMQGYRTAQVSAPECCHTMWALEAESLAFRIDPRIFESYLEIDHDSLAWLGSGLVPHLRAAGQVSPSEATRSGVGEAVDGIAEVDQARLVGAMVSEEDIVECLELVVRENLSKHAQVSIFETVRERLDAAESAIGRLALVVHQQHVILSEGVASWRVA